MVDPGRLRVLLARMLARRDRLEVYARLAPEEYLGDEQAVLASKYLLITAIEDALALANHVIASEGYRSPADYADAFRVLVEHRVLEPALGARLEAMARFRNLLVHVYAEVDDRRVQRFLRDDVVDLAALATAVLDRFPEVRSGTA